jgi:biotin carboxyl carrier protein
MDFEFLVDGQRRLISLEKKGDRFVIRKGNSSVEIDVQAISGEAISIIVGERSYLVHIVRDKGKKYIAIAGEVLVVQPPGAGEQRIDRGEEGGGKGRTLVKAPMPGKVIMVSVAEGDAVRKNQTLAIVEAMKMENEIKSPLEARIKKIYVASGDLVDSDKPLIELDPKV